MKTIKALSAEVAKLVHQVAALRGAIGGVKNAHRVSGMRIDLLSARVGDLEQDVLNANRVAVDFRERLERHEHLGAVRR